MKSPTACIIVIGTEHLYGEITDTNSLFLSQQLRKMGMLTTRKWVSGDDQKAIVKSLKESCKEARWVFLIGGLGPTHDDLTRESVGQYFREPLVFDEHIWQGIIMQFQRHGQAAISENNKKQAMVFKHARVLVNRNGTAPGQYLKKKGQHVFLLPGPPVEFEAMFMESVVPILQAYKTTPATVRQFVLLNISESRAAMCLGKSMKTFPLDDWGIYAKPGEVRVRMTFNPIHTRKYSGWVRTLKKNLPENTIFIACESLIEALHAECIRQHISVAVAESLTAGQLAEKWASVPGASRCFAGGVIVYSNELKTRLLGVPKKILENHGAVSRETVTWMLKGLQKKTGATLCMALSGIAGPTGATPGKPVGTVWIGILKNDVVRIESSVFKGNRIAVQQKAVQRALGLAYEVITES